MTGRAAGFCAGFGVPGYANPFPGRGWGRGGGFGRGWGGGGRGWRNRFWATGVPGWAWAAGVPGWAWFGQAAPAQSAEAEVTALQQQAAVLKQSLDAINERLAHLEAEKEPQE